MTGNDSCDLGLDHKVIPDYYKTFIVCVSYVKPISIFKNDDILCV